MCNSKSSSETADVKNSSRKIQRSTKMGEVDNNEDRLSELPRILIDLILEKLEMDEAVRTSILSRKWRYMWSTLTKLVLERPFFRKIRKESSAVNVVDRILLIHNGPIHKFLFDPVYYISEYERPNFDLWILILSRKGIKELTLDSIYEDTYNMPSHIFSCENLTYLNLKWCILNPPASYNGFRILNTLILKHVLLSVEMGALISTLLSLEELYFESSTGVENMKIIPQNLSRLLLVNNRKFLWKCLNIQNSKLRELHVEIYDKDQKDMDEQCKDFNADMLFTNFHELGKLQLDGFSVKFFGAGTIASFTLLDIKLSSFSFVNFDQVSCAFVLLRNTPNLKKLEIEAIKVTNDEIEQIELDTMEAAANSAMLLDRLQSVKLSMFKGVKAELLFVKLLLSLSPSLEDFVIISDNGMAAVDELRTAKQLMKFTRASPLSNIIYT